MTDSIKRIIFGPKKSLNLIITICAMILYNNEKIDSNKININTNYNTENNSEMNIISLSPKTKELNQKKIFSNKRKIKNPSYQNGIINYEHMKKNLMEKTKKINNNSYSMNIRKEIQNNINNLKENKNNNTTIEDNNINIEKKEPEEDPFDNSIINNDIENEIEETEKEFSDYIKNFISANPLSYLDNIDNLDIMINQTKQVFDNFMAYQNLFYQQIKHSVNINNKFKDLLKEYNEKFNYINKKKYNLQKKLNKENFKKLIYVNVNRNDNKNIKKITPFKGKEIDLFKDFLVPLLDNNKHEKNNNINNGEKKEILMKSLKTILSEIDIDIILNDNNLKEEEKNFIKNITNKYNLISKKEIIKELSDEDDDKILNDEIPNKFEYVITSKIDENDIKLEQYLKYFYSKRKLPKIIFKKTSPKNYEYGTQKIMVKIEKDNIRIRHVGGYSSLDKFIDNNAINEEIKLKKQSGKKKQNKK